ncbi:LamG domain-containing protein [Spirosoma linguale]|uniref:LamG domain-containing protein n=1 Tax=Spirosoma linguale TaxID=108 RepID=UPI003CC7CBEF
MIAYYPFTNNANDASGTNNNGVVYGATPVDGQNGLANSAYRFADGNKIIVANNTSLKITNEFSFSAWVRLRSFAGRNNTDGSLSSYGTHAIFAKDCDQGWFSCTLITDSKTPNTVILSSGNWLGGWQYYYFTYTVGNWVHVAIVNKNNRLEQYINGKMVSASFSNIDFTQVNSANLYIGGMACWPYFFNGDLDEMRFYNRGITESEVAAMYEFEKKPIFSINHGNWNDTSVWSCNCVPTSTDVVQVSHSISVPAKTAAYAWNVQYNLNGQVALESDARLILSK